MPSMSGPSDPAAFAATYHDGRTAVGRRVTARVQGDDLVISDEAGHVIDRWPLAEIRSVEAWQSDGMVRLRLGFDRDERLTLDHPSDLARLGPWARLAGRTVSGWKTQRWRLAAWAIGAFASIAFVVLVAVPWLARQIASVIPSAVEEQIGERVTDQIVTILAAREGVEPSHMVCAAVPGQQAIDNLVSRLNRRAAGAVAPEVLVIRSKDVNAFALPGGKIILLHGLIDFATDGDELAGVLAHEIGHLMERHPLSVAIERGGVTLLIGFLVGDAFGGMAVAGLGEVLAGSAYSRSAEAEADAIGIRLMNQATIDVRAMARVFERLAREDKDLTGVLRFLSTHPPSLSRAAQARSTGASTRPALDADAWRAIKTMCD